MFSLKFRIILLPLTTPAAPSTGLLLLSVGAKVSIIIALLLPREFAVPGAANVSVALLPVASLIVPLLSANAVVLK